MIVALFCIMTYNSLTKTKRGVYMLTKEQFQEKLSSGILILDGATGSNLRRAGMPENCCVMGGCHVFWKHKKRILRTEYHMVWRSPQDLNPTVHFDRVG